MNHLETALAHHQAGRLDAAVASYRAVLAENPHQPDALHMMGVIAQQRGNSKLALNMIEASLAINPDLAMAWYNRALILRALRKKDEAIQSAQHALSLDPSLADAWDLVGSLLRQKKKFEEARICHDRALQLQPDNTAFQKTYAVLLLALGDIHRAFEFAHPDKRPDPYAEDLPLITGNILQYAGYPEKAIPFYRESFRRHPQLKNLPTDEAMARLKIGDFEEGWKLWQDRSDRSDERIQSIPKWQGEAIEHILLYEDQGFGDIMHTIRYVPKVQERVHRISLYLSTDALANLLAASFPGISIIVGDDLLPQVEARCALMSLPYIFGTNLTNIPCQIPYLHVPSGASSLAKEKMQTRRKPTLGLVWAGNINYGRDQTRSLHFKELSPLLEIAKEHIVSLQKGPQKEQADFENTSILDADPWLDNFSTTAGFIQELDLIITVDTSVAHLAGGLGKPVWILLPFDPDWRWMMEREDSPWYPTVRLFRQTAPHQWGSVIERVKEDLIRFINGDFSVLRPKIWIGPPARENKNALPLWD